MTCKLHPESSIEALPPDKYAWGCCIRQTFRFTYVYGPVADYLAVLRTPHCGDHLHKGECDTLAEARQEAQARATELARIFEGIGSARELAAEDYRRELLSGRAADAILPYRDRA